jgi:hypothetical protein
MIIEDITDNDLREFCQWFADWHGCKVASASVIATCMTGHFKTFPKAADKLLNKCIQLRLLEVKKGIVTLLS